MFSGCEDEVFTASEITGKFNENSSTKQISNTFFKEGITELDVQTLEETLKKDAVNNSKEDRWDFDFFTPSCRKIHVKVKLEYNDRIKSRNSYFNKQGNLNIY